MFSLLMGFWEYFFTPRNYHVLIIGLDHAGKTTILERIKSRYGSTPGLPPDRIPPTIGMNLAKVYYHGSHLIIWDLGGQVKMRSMWEKYYAEADVVIFLLDSADVARFDEAKIAYDNVVKDHIMSNTRVVLVANKQDLRDALPPSDIEVNFITNKNAPLKSSVLPVSALTCSGLDEMLSTVVNAAKIKRQGIS